MMKFNITLRLTHWDRCYCCQQTGHTSNQCRASKIVNVAERDDISDAEYDDKEIFIGPNDVLNEEEEYDNKGQSYVLHRLVLASPKQIDRRHPTA